VIYGFSRSDCNKLCDEGINPDAIQSEGCLVKNSNNNNNKVIKETCADLKLLKCNATNNFECRVTWTLPPTVDLLPVSFFTFSLGDTYIQELEIYIELPAEDSPSISNFDLKDNTVRISRANVTAQLQLTPGDFLLFDIRRQYELNYVLQTSESKTLSSDGTPSNDWKMTAVFLPLQTNIIEASTSDQQYFGSSVANKITIQFTKPNYYIGNIEGRVYQSGALFLTLVNVLAGILGIFQLFGALISKCTSLGKGAYAGDYFTSKQPGEGGSSVKSPRYDRATYNPYDIQSMMQALVDNDFRAVLNDGKRARKTLEEEE